MKDLSVEVARRLQRHRTKVAKSRAQLKADQTARNEAIQEAIRKGDGVEREIAAASGVSRSRVSQLRRALTTK